MAGQFPVFYGPEKLGTVPNIAVPANINVSTGTGVVGKAIGEFGSALLDLGIKYDLKEANTQFSKYKSDIDGLDQLRSQEVLNAKDDNEVKAIYKKYEQQKEALKTNLTNNRASQVAELWDNTQTALNTKALFDDRRKKAIENDRTRIFEKQQEVLRDPTKLAEFEKELARSILLDRDNPDDVGPTFTKLEAAKILADTRKMAEIGAITNLYGAGQYEEARKAAKAAKLLTPRERESLINTIDTEERSVRLKIAAAEKIKYDETEKELHKQFIAGTLTNEENDRVFNAGESDVATHRAYDTILKNKDLMDSDAILAEKWLNGLLTKTDIQEAQKEGRFRDSNVVASWVSRLGKGQFDAGAYDRALAKVREVRTNKGKYDEVRLWLLQNAEDLGVQWNDLRNKLETNMNAKGDAVGPHVSRAHGLIDAYVKDNPEINDGTLNSIRKVQQLHDAIDARADYTPEKMRDLTEALLLPYEEEKAKSWFGGLFEMATKFGPLPMLIRGSKRVRAKKQRVFQSVLLIQPVSKEEFNEKVISLKSLFGEDSKEAKQFYDRYIDSYEWEIE